MESNQEHPKMMPALQCIASRIRPATASQCWMARELCLQTSAPAGSAPCRTHHAMHVLGNRIWGLISEACGEDYEFNCALDLISRQPRGCR